MCYDVLMILKINWSTVSDFLRGRPVRLEGDVTGAVRRIAALSFTVVVMLILRLSIMGNTAPKFQYQDNPASFQESCVMRVFNYLYLYSLNTWLLLSPWWLCFDWAMGCIPVVTSFTDQRLFAPLFMIILLALLVRKVVLLLDGHLGRCFAISLCLLIVPFLPAMNIFFRVGFVIAERNLYMSSIGWVMIIVLSVHMVSRNSFGRKIVQFFIPMLVTVFILRTMNRTTDWMSEYNLFTSGAKVCPLNAKVHYNIGKVNQEAGNINAAIRSYKESIRLAHDYDQPMNNLGNILKDQQNFTEAEYYLEMAVKVSPFFATGWMNLGIVKDHMKKKEEANRCYAEATRHRRNYPDAFYNWANLHLDYKEYEQALQKFDHAIQLKPDHLPAWQNKIMLLADLGDIAQLLKSSEQVTGMFPGNDHLHYLIGNSIGKTGRMKESAKYLHKSVQINPRHSDALGSLGVVYHQLKKYEEAEKYYKQALHIDPNSQGTLQNYRKLQRVMKKTKPA